MRTHTPAEIKAALTIFIKSGSANGNEAMRRTCLKLIPQFAQAPAMLKFIERWDEIVVGGDKLTRLPQWAQDFHAEARAILNAVRGEKP